MADEFDPLKQTANKPAEALYATVHKITNHQDDDLLRPEHETILKAGNKQADKPPQQQIYHKLDFTSNAPKAPTRPTNPFNEDVQKPSPPAYVNKQLSQGAEASAPRTESNKKNTENYNRRYYQPQAPTPPPPPPPPPPACSSEEYYEYQPSHKKKGFTATMDRLVQRFPLLGVLYSPPLSVSADNYTARQDYAYTEEFESDQAPQLVEAYQTSRKLTAAELALNDRYSNKLRTQIIYLQAKDQTQPVDLCIHRETYTIYACDVGRSVVEIFDMYGKLQHVIDDQLTLKFQPTAIAVTNDGTIIVASHFNHRLQMYSPIDSQENGSSSDGYHFEQYKLGSPGHDVYQFHHPADIAVDSNDGYLYVCDRGNYRIQVMRPEGVCERVIDLLINDHEQSAVAPIQIAHQLNRQRLVCIIDQGDAVCFIPKYSDGPTYVEPLYILDNDGLGFQGASGITVDSNDRIFISDTGHNRIVICTPEGGYISHFGSEGNGAGELKRPCGLDITYDGTIVVTDSGNKRLQLFGSMREKANEEKQASTGKADNKNDLLIDTESAAK